MTTVPDTFVIVNPIFIHDLIANYRLFNSIEYLRGQIRDIKAIGRANYEARKGQEVKYIRFTKVPYNVLEYMSYTRSKSEIIVLLYILYRSWNTKTDCYSRFKIKDLSKLSGIDRRRLSRALNHLIKLNAIKKEKQHPNFVIKYGHIYRIGPALQKVPGKIFYEKISKRGHRG